MPKQDTARLTFYGATETVTGSKFLLSHGEDTHVLVDCGLFQGYKDLRLRNWQPLPIDARNIDAVLLTHAHIDHSGYLPRLVREGFSGPVFCTPGTAELACLLLPDAAKLEEEDAAHANRRGFSKHSPALPLFTRAEASRALRLLRPVSYGQRGQIHHDMHFTFRDAGHILGSSSVEVEVVSKGGGTRRVLFSGDLGRYGEPIMRDPSPIPAADYVVLESTYGDREHPPEDAKTALAQIINDAAGRGGRVLIPAFAVGRAQSVLFLLRQLEEEGRIPALPVYLDSPMAQSATRIYEQYQSSLDEEVAATVRRGDDPFRTEHLTYITTMRQSQKLAASIYPSIVISASGMATGGRVLHHLTRLLPDRRSSVVFVGFQAAGSRGRRLSEGEPEVKIHAQMTPVRAHIEQIEGLSAHADQGDILRWLSGLPHAPKCVYLVHGEPSASAALQDKLRERFGWKVEVAQYGQEIELR